MHGVSKDPSSETGPAGRSTLSVGDVVAPNPISQAGPSTFFRVKTSEAFAVDGGQSLVIFCGLFATRPLGEKHQGIEFVYKKAVSPLLRFEYSQKVFSVTTFSYVSSYHSYQSQRLNPRSNCFYSQLEDVIYSFFSISFFFFYFFFFYFFSFINYLKVHIHVPYTSACH